MTEVHMNGQLTFNDHESFRSILAVFNNPDTKSVVLNISQLSEIDSSGLGMFMVARNTAEIKNVSLSLKGAGGHVRKMLNLGNFDDLFVLEN